MDKESTPRIMAQEGFPSKRSGSGITTIFVPGFDSDSHSTQICFWFPGFPATTNEGFAPQKRRHGSHWHSELVDPDRGKLRRTSRPRPSSRARGRASSSSGASAGLGPPDGPEGPGSGRAGWVGVGPFVVGVKRRGLWWGEEEAQVFPRRLFLRFFFFLRVSQGSEPKEKRTTAGGEAVLCFLLFFSPWDRFLPSWHLGCVESGSNPNDPNVLSAFSCHSSG